MNLRIFLPLCALACSAHPLRGISQTPRQPAAVKVDIDTAQTEPPVPKDEFGMFIENLGPLVYRSLWAEMLDDRKFYFPIVPRPAAAEKPSLPFPGMQLRRWAPVGLASAVTMDPSDPFVGDHSPRIALDGAQPRGIRQAGLSLIQGKTYAGRIWLRGTPGARVQVTLAWGDGANEQQTFTLPPLTANYAKYPLRFTAGASTGAASLAVTGAGAGDFHIGTLSLMPTDNVDGFRPDTIALLRTIHSGMWRLPGGNFLSDWSWYDGVGPIDKRPPTFDYAWNAMQPNDVGMNEFMTLCRLIDTTPYITVNAGFGDAHSAMEEVEYMNGPVTTRLGAERDANGHPAPYGIRYWDIGNEPYGDWQLGHTSLHDYELKHNEFASAMRRADPSITLLASGSMLEPMNLKGELRAKYVENLQPLEGGPEDWTGGLLAHSWGNFSGITEHWYASPGQRFNVARAKSLPLDAPTSAGYDKVTQTPLEYARYPANIVHLKAQEWEGYQQRFPKMIPNNIFLSIDEYAYFGGHPGGEDLENALAYGMTLNEMMRHTSFLKRGAHTMGVSTLDYTPTAAVMNSTGLLYQLYGAQFVGTIPVALTGSSPQPAPQYPVGGDQPLTNSGSPTYPLDMFAAETPDHRALVLSVVNATAQPQSFSLNLAGARVSGDGKLWQITGPTLDAKNRVGQPQQVTLNETSAGGGKQEIHVAPISINVYRFPVQRQATASSQGDQ